MENPGIDPGTSHMLSERSTTWANSPYDYTLRIFSDNLRTWQTYAQQKLISAWASAQQLKYFV